MVLLSALAMLVCFVLLARIVDLFFIASLDKISTDLRLSSDAAGATLMAVGSSAPELFVALFSVLKPGEHQAIGIGSIVGSAIFNLLAIVGAAALVRKTKLTWQPAARDFFFYTLSVLLLILFIWDGSFTMNEAIILLGVYVVYVVAVIYWKKVLPYNDLEYDEPEAKINKKGIIGVFDRLISRIFPDEKHYYQVFLLSVLLIAGLSWALVELAVFVSAAMNIPESIIALTVLAVGTSVPDLFSSLIVARQGRGDMAVSNAIGSNIFDILVGLGLPLGIFILLYGGTVESGGDITRSAVILFGSVVLLLLLLIFSKWKLGKLSGGILIGIYILYIIQEILFV
ncbi:K+-dependent Na+/Ca+ exchanger related-protein [Tangfeifania diversioriginum]|uniref:K+-dependent Na+/Ca+ exchanger related-protein n=1 Tax=Tangfeifania diversioriginum TaxID=1168035 RepID=A0A1M6GNY2_9BACT|nr:calcium/sodium antiporter [Tangfeifania diversioriginum]SHJ11566.1 K+-dependent Na+/Ca+ exchanger related-protein [Tangfeifania diversioriginum]